MARVTIFHTSDMHNKLTRARADEIRRLKESSPDSLMLDSGDAIWAGNVFWRPGGEPVLDLMNRVPYDAMCMGNREFHFLSAGLASKTSSAAFPVLSANLRTTVPHSPFPIPHSHFFSPSGLRVCVFGLSVPCITERMLVKRMSDFYFDQPIKAARELVPKLRGECDLLVALTHIGIKLDRELAAQVPGIDLILGGHTHAITETPERVGDTWILHHGHHCHHIGKVDINVPPLLPGEGRGEVPPLLLGEGRGEVPPPIELTNELIPLGGT